MANNQIQNQRGHLKLVQDKPVAGGSGNGGKKPRRHTWGKWLIVASLGIAAGVSCGRYLGTLHSLGWDGRESKGMDMLEQSLGELENSVNNLHTTMETGMDGMLRGMGKVNGKLDGLHSSVDELGSGVDSLGNGSGLDGQMGGLEDSVGSAEKSLGKLERDVKKLRRQNRRNMELTKQGGASQGEKTGGSVPEHEAGGGERQ